MKTLVEGYSMQMLFMGIRIPAAGKGGSKTLAGSEGKQGQGTQTGTQVEGGTGERLIPGTQGVVTGGSQGG